MSQTWRTQCLAVAVVLLAATTHAQDGLTGFWELMTREERFEASAVLTVQSGGTVQLVIEAQFGPGFVGLADGGGEVELPDSPVFTEGFNVKSVVTGSWEVTDAHISLSAIDPRRSACAHRSTMGAEGGSGRA